MKTTIEVFIIMRAGKIDKRDHEIAKKTLFFQFVNNTSYGFPTHVTSLVLEMLLKLTKKTLISLKSMKQYLSRNYYRLECISKVQYEI